MLTIEDILKRFKPHIEVPRSNVQNPVTAFVRRANEQIKLIEDGEKSDLWFKFETIDGVEIGLVKLCNGATIMKLDGVTKRIEVSSRKEAVDLLQSSIALAKAGHFDALFAATAKKTKQHQS